jgi:hypothetical protein
LPVDGAPSHEVPGRSFRHRQRLFERIDFHALKKACSPFGKAGPVMKIPVLLALLIAVFLAGLSLIFFVL